LPPRLFAAFEVAPVKVTVASRFRIFSTHRRLYRPPDDQCDAKLCARSGDPDVDARRLQSDSVLGVHQPSVEAGADIDTPQLVQGLVVVGENGAVDHGGDDDAAAGRVRIGRVDTLLHDALYLFVHVGELGIAIGMIADLAGLAIGLQTIAERTQPAETDEIPSTRCSARRGGCADGRRGGGIRLPRVRSGF
jgi:hypothetical protein